MGFQDRDYERYEERPGGFFTQGRRRMMVTNIVIVCAAIFLLDAFTPFAKKTFISESGEVRQEQTRSRLVSDAMSLKANLFSKPWQCWQLVTYGFAHASLGSRSGIWHVLFNMFTLWMLGRFVEMKYGSKEFVTFYVVSLVVAGLAWVLIRMAFGQTQVEFDAEGQRWFAPSECVGASGAVTAVVILFICNFPKEKLYLYGIIAMPAWVLGVLLIGIDMYSAFFAKDGVAHDAHLAGIVFGFVYFKFGWRLSNWLPSAERIEEWKQKSRTRNLKIHQPIDGDDKRDLMADEVLSKLHREGEASLTKKEKKILEEYSRRMKQKHR